MNYQIKLGCFSRFFMWEAIFILPRYFLISQLFFRIRQFFSDLCKYTCVSVHQTKSLNRHFMSGTAF